MKYIFYLLTIISLIFNSKFSNAQEDESWHCLTPEMNNLLYEKYPEALIEKNRLDEFVRNYRILENKSDQVFIIPVVVHVVHDYGVENISYEQIVESIEFMNRDFRLMRADTSMIVPAFKGIAADSRIEFRLARKDPWGNCSVGVTRTASETTHSGGEDAKIAAPSWPRNKYLNIWVVRSLPGGAAGWAYYPSNYTEGYDGIILIHSYMGSIGTGSIGRASTLTHEAGHYLNLPHPWGSTNNPGLPSNCDIDDGIEDTPNTIGHTTCAITAVTCGSLDNVQNFMDYSYCGKMYTEGQSQVMRAVLNSSIAGRNNLWTEQNLIETGVHLDYLPPICEPIADFIADKRVGCEGMQVSFNNLTYNTDVIDSVLWYFPGAETEFSNTYNSQVIYKDAGIHNVELFVSNQTDQSIQIKENYIHIYKTDDAFSLPYTESFETAVFPFFENSGNGFFTIDKGTGNWHQTPLVAYSGNRSLRIRQTNNKPNTINTIMLPNIKLPSSDIAIEVSFYAAFGRVSEFTADRLKFYVSSDCGETKRIVAIIGTSILATANTSSFANYMPHSSHWKKHSFIINPSSIQSETIRIIIEAEAGGGNNLYIDDLSINMVSNVEQSQYNFPISVFPNPFTDEVLIELPELHDEAELQFYNSAGQLIGKANTKDNLYNASSIFDGHSAGLYTIKITTGNKYKVLRIVKLNN